MAVGQVVEFGTGGGEAGECACESGGGLLAVEEGFVVGYACFDFFLGECGEFDGLVGAFEYEGVVFVDGGGCDNGGHCLLLCL